METLYTKFLNFIEMNDIYYKINILDQSIVIKKNVYKKEDINKMDLTEFVNLVDDVYTENCESVLVL